MKKGQLQDKLEIQKEKRTCEPSRDTGKAGILLWFCQQPWFQGSMTLHPLCDVAPFQPSK